MTDHKPAAKVGLMSVVGQISQVLELHESQVLTDEMLEEHLGDLTTELRGAVDRRIAFLDHLGARGSGDKPGTGLIGKYQELFRAYRDACERAEGVRDRIKSRTVDIIKAKPDLKFQGDFGKLGAQKNSQASLEVDLPLHERQFRNIIDESNIGLVPPEYIKTIEIKVLDTESLKKDLIDGFEIPWARTQQGYHLRVRR